MGATHYYESVNVRFLIEEGEINLKKMPITIFIYFFLTICFFFFEYYLPYINKYLNMSAPLGAELVFGLFIYFIWFVYGVFIVFAVIYPILSYKRYKLATFIPLLTLVITVILFICFSDHPLSFWEWLFMKK